MSKPSHDRGLPETEAQCIVSNLRISPRKLNLVAAMIRNLPAERAVATLTFSKRRIARSGEEGAAKARSPTPRTTIRSTSTAWSSRAPRLAARS